MKKGTKIAIIVTIVVLLGAVLYVVFHKKKATSDNPDIQLYIDRIYANSEWMAQIATKKGTKTEAEQVLADATWALAQWGKVQN